jgi:hypothetical protein
MAQLAAKASRLLFDLLCATCSPIQYPRPPSRRKLPTSSRQENLCIQRETGSCDTQSESKLFTKDINYFSLRRPPGCLFSCLGATKSPHNNPIAAVKGAVINHPAVEHTLPSGRVAAS